MSPSTGSPRRTSTSCNVMVTSPCSIWKVWVSGHHRSTKAVIRPWSISLPDCLRSPSKPSALMMSTTRSTTIGSRLENSSVRLRQVRDPGSYTKRNHGLAYDSKCMHIVWIKCMYIREIFSTVFYLPIPNSFWPMGGLQLQHRRVNRARLHMVNPSSICSSHTTQEW